MFSFYVAQNFAQAIEKADDVLSSSKDTDSSRRYTALALKGQALLKLGRREQAVPILGELEQMVSNRMALVVGDEVAFLERLATAGLETERVSRLANTLARVCRDPAFKKRLEALSIA